MLVFTSDQFVLPLPPGHRFPMAKYARLRQAVECMVPAALIEEAPAVTDAQLALVHSHGYLRAAREGTLDRRAARRIGFPWSPELVARERRSVGGTLAGARAALAHGRGVNLAGGTHHAHPTHGGGFCLFNDAGVALRVLQQEGAIQRALVVDLDVHQGDGTARIFRDDPAVFTLSVHGAANYPLKKPPSDLDVGLPRGTGDAAYLAALHGALDRAFAVHHADLVVYQAGVDPWEGDRLGTLALTAAGMAARDAAVFARCDAEGVPVVVTMGGGYAPEVDDIVALHAQTVGLALAGWRPSAPPVRPPARLATPPPGS